MVFEDCLMTSSEWFEAVPSHVLMHPAKDVVTGPGGAWQAAIWFAEPDLIRAAIVPLEGGLPVALTSVWVDPQEAAEAAVAFAKIAAEV